MTEKKPFWNRRTYCLITGASQGIGRQIAIDFAKNVGNQSAFFLLARNIENLNETKRLVQEVNPDLDVFVHSLNLSEPIGVEIHKLIGLSLTVFKAEATDYELAMVVHNAGSVGDISELAVEMRNIEKLNSYLTFNLHSVVLLTAEFLRYFEPEAEKTETALVNITSLCAIQPVASMGYYCIGKAAREMYFKILATENPNLTIVSYAPGPVSTDMADEIINNTRSEEVKNMFVGLRTEEKLLSPAQTIKKLVFVLENRFFENGGRVDYYDEVPT